MLVVAIDKKCHHQDHDRDADPAIADQQLAVLGDEFDAVLNLQRKLVTFQFFAGKASHGDLFVGKFNSSTAIRPAALKAQTGAGEKLRELPPQRLFFGMKITLEPNCPRCGSRDVRRSRRTGLVVAMLRPCLLDPYRCRSCFRSFFRPKTAAANGVAVSLARGASAGR
jgi:hypothetical protein